MSSHWWKHYAPYFKTGMSWDYANNCDHRHFLTVSFKYFSNFFCKGQWLAFNNISSVHHFLPNLFATSSWFSGVCASSMSCAAQVPPEAVDDTPTSSCGESVLVAPACSRCTLDAVCGWESGEPEMVATWVGRGDEGTPDRFKRKFVLAEGRPAAPTEEANVVSEYSGK